MAQVKRIWFASKITVAMSIAALVHFRLGVNQLYPMALNEYSGPFSDAVATLKIVVPVSIAAILVATWLWVFYSPVKQEKVRARGGPPR